MIDVLRFTVPPRASRIRARGSQAQAVCTPCTMHITALAFLPLPLYGFRLI